MFASSEIQFHTAGNHLLYNENDFNKNIGILKLCAKKPVDDLENPLTSPDFGLRSLSNRRTKIHVLFTVDCSASMSETISMFHQHTNLSKMRKDVLGALGGPPIMADFGNIYENEYTSKIQQVIYTLKRIFKELAKESDKNNTEVHVAVMGFEEQLRPILDFTHITPENVDALVATLDNIDSYTSTNIEIALKSAQKTLKQKMGEDTRIYHVFMTDGDITEGENKACKLKTLIDTSYPTIFIGFGKDHDAALLNELSNYLHGEYYFIDKIENSGLVYGEIVYNIMYHVIGAIKLSVCNGLIYDWKKNEWTSEINVANLSHDCEKLFHLITYGNIYDVEIEIISQANTSTTEGIAEHIDTLYCYPPLLEIVTTDPDSVIKLDTEKGIVLPVNLSKYHFRQKTQELLFETRKLLEEYQK